MTQPATRRRIAIALAIAIAIIIPSFASFAFMRSPAPASHELSDPAPQTITSFYGENGAKSFDELFQNIKSMTIEFNFTSTEGGSQSLSCDRISYMVGMASMDDGSVVYKVNLTDTSFDANYAHKESALVWVDPTSSNILQVLMDGKYWTGADAQKESGVLSMITADHWLSLLNSSTVVPSVANHTVIIGSTKLYATMYTGLSSLTEFQNLVIVVGSIPHSGMQLVLSSNYFVPGNGYGSFRVLSLSFG